jgi:hypothetical protein
MKRAVLALFALFATLPSAARAQSAPATDARAELLARGAPADVADQVGRLVAQAVAEGLPARTLTDKALEGLAKNAPADRVLAAVADLRNRLAAARVVVIEGGVATPSGMVIMAAEHALARGVPPESVRDLLRSAGRPEAASTGLLVAGLLAAQGLERSAAAQAVERAYRDGRSADEVLELPSLAALMIARGMTIPEVTRRMLAGQPLAVERPDVGRALAAPPNRGSDASTSTPRKP